MGNAMVLTLVLMAHRGEFHAQSCQPYLDALPLDYPNRDKVIRQYVDRAEKECEKDCDDQWWTYRAATGLFLQDLPIEDTFATAYLHGRIMGRHHLWQPLPDCGGGWGWLDVHLQELKDAANTEQVPAPK